MQVLVALRVDRWLLRALLVLGVDSLHNVHALRDDAKRGEALAIEVRVIAKVDEELRGARVRSSRSIRDGSFGVALHDGIVGDVSVLPLLRDGRVSVDAKLHDKARHNTEETIILEVATAREREQLVETINTKWPAFVSAFLVRSNAKHLRPCTSDVEHNIARADLDTRREGDLEEVWSLCGLDRSASSKQKQHQKRFDLPIATSHAKKRRNGTQGTIDLLRWTRSWRVPSTSAERARHSV